GETAEMPDFYQSGEYDVAGFIVGVVDQKKIINGSAIREGDICIGLPSNGLHTNGYTLARKIAFETAGLKVGQAVPELGTTIDKALMKVHRCYAPLVLPLLKKYKIAGMAHITGGGIPGNLKRIIPDGLSATVKTGSWPVPAIFDYLGKAGGVSDNDMFEAFNMGVGYVLVVGRESADQIMGSLSESGEKAYRIGEIRSGEQKVVLN
ncbi:MAG: phosphoribosylformylglycinamidine cyclo-ligase, partial [Candidatus Zixiibacteriota bacterium]